MSPLIALSPPSGEKIDNIAENVSFLVEISNFKVPKNLRLVERSDLNERVQLVENYQIIPVTYLGHSRNEGAPERSFWGVPTINYNETNYVIC